MTKYKVTINPYFILPKLGMDYGGSFRHPALIKTDNFTAQKRSNKVLRTYIAGLTDFYAS